MSILPMHLIRYGVLLLVGAATSACSTDGDPLPDPGSISLSLSQASATVPQSGVQDVTATLTRIGGFTGVVSLTVTGAGPGVTASVSNLQTSGAVTTATVTIIVGAAVPPAVYSLVVHATGSGVSEVTQAFALTITPNLGFSISLSAAALSIVQGASTPTTTVSISRGANAGALGLYVTGLPTGVTASFDPDDWPVGYSTILTLTVDAVAVPGVYDLRVNAYDAEQEGEVSTPLTLTVTAPPPAPGYSLSLSAPTLSIAQGASSPSTKLNLVRTNFTGNVTFSVENLPPGVTAFFYPYSPISGTHSELWLGVAPNAPTGTFSNLLVRGVAPGLADRTAPLTLTITIAPFVLTLSPSTLSITQGSVKPTTVNLVRNNFTGPVTLYVDIGDFHGTMPDGVTAAFGPNPTSGNNSVLTFTVSAAAVPGVYELWVYAEASTGWFDGIPFTLIVTAASL